MAVFVDPTEGAATSRLPPIPHAVVVPELEALTGADLMLSVLDMPATTPTLIRKHCAAGALLVQRKSGQDLVNSLGDHMTDQLARMHEVGTRQSQRVLLFTGCLSMGENGVAVIDGRDAMGRFWAAQAGLARWNDRGGVVETLPSDVFIPQWVERRLKHLAEYATPAGEVRFVYPPNEFPMDPPLPDDPLQLPIRVRDGRVVLASLAGIGPKLAERIWEFCGENLGWALTLLSDEASPKVHKIPGIGVQMIRNIRQQCGLDGPVRLMLVGTDNVTEVTYEIHSSEPAAV